MCGIAGLISSATPEFEIEQTLRRMEGTLRHRGPDDQGVSTLPNGAGGFVNTRLAILDLSAAGHQPMSTPDGRFHITFNGEIYNFVELRDQLIGEGVEFKSRCDTEVILRLYERDGPACVHKLLGMFAFAIWDARECTCFLARDPLGIKPLYYSAFPRDLMFASELRTLIQADRTFRDVSAEALYGYFRHGTVPEPLTLIEGIRRLPAGHYLIWQDNKVALTKYWELSFPESANGQQSPRERVRAAFSDSVKRHFVSDVPVGVFLSGGIDSTAVVAIARQSGYDDLRTFNISLEDPKLNEGDVAARTAKHFGTVHSEWHLDGKTGAALLEDFLSKIDHPTIDGFNTFCVSKVAHDAGLKVVLSGLGGDELFGGYKSFRRVPAMTRFVSMLAEVPTLKRGVAATLERAFPGRPIRRIGSLLREPARIESAYETVRGIFTPREAAMLCHHYLGPDVVYEKSFVSPLISARTSGDAVTQLEVERYMRNQLLRDSDIFSMAWSLELRVPFVDRKIIEAVTEVPASVRLQPGKRLLLDAVPEIPEWVANRKKQGFVFPFDRWMKEEWKPVLAEKRKLAGIELASWYQKWSIFVLDRWLEALQLTTEKIV